MTTAEASSKVLEQVFHNIRQATDANLKLQQEVVRQWSALLPISVPQSAWTETVRKFQSEWAATVSELAHKHREVIDQQFKAAIESLDAALKVSESTTPEEYRRRAEKLCRKTIDCMREFSEAQIREFQEAVTKWTEVATKAGT
ncbi:MAG: hypothetical protein R3C10_11005 [Pirellulales bacterium]